MSNFFHRWNDVTNLERGETVAPHFIDLHLCYTCNQHCVGCAYDGKLNQQPQMWMTEKDAFRCVSELMDAGVRGFDFAGGGEPTVAPYTAELMEYIGGRGGTFGLITNGTLLKGPVLDACLRYGTYVRCSLESSNADDYRTYKVVDANHWPTVLSNLQEAVKRRNLAQSKLEISLKFAVGKHHRGLNHYADGIALGEMIGANRVTFKALRECPDELSLEDKQVEDRILRGYLLHKEAQNVHHWIVPWKTEDIAQCWLSGLHALLEWDGNLYICCFHQWRKDQHRIGNMLEHSFREVWFSDEHKAKQKAIDKHACAKADCKFFKHHKDYYEAKRGMVNFM